MGDETAYSEVKSEELRLLRLKIIAARELPKKYFLRKGKPFIRVRLINRDDKRVLHTVYTAAKKFTVNPRWDEELFFIVHPLQHRLHLDLFYKGVMTNKHVGTLDIFLGEVSAELGWPNKVGKFYSLVSPKNSRQVTGTLQVYHSYLQNFDDPQRMGESFKNFVARAGQKLSSASMNLETLYARLSSRMLPAGWEVRQDSLGTLYYVNHIERTTCWDPPPMVDPLTIHTEGPVGTITDLTELPFYMLPPCWSMQIAPNGREFFIDHLNKATTWNDPRTGLPSQIPDEGNIPNRPQLATFEILGDLPEGWEERIYPDGRSFFINHLHKATTWDDPRFNDKACCHVHSPHIGEIRRRYLFLRSRLSRPSGPPLIIKVRCSDIIHDTLISFASIPKPECFKNSIWIKMLGEDSNQHKNYLEEWIILVIKELTAESFGLFKSVAVEKTSVSIINPNSHQLRDYISYYHLMGKMMALALFHGNILDLNLGRPFYRMMLGRRVVLEDLKGIYPDFYNQYQKMLGDKKFVIINEEGKEPLELPIEEYIYKEIQEKIVEPIDAQMTVLMSGFNEVVPLSLIQVFESSELEIVLCGSREVDVREWMQYTQYAGGYHANHLVVKSFWKLVTAFNPQTRLDLLKWTTGFGRVPATGLCLDYKTSNLSHPFTLQKWGTPSDLPRAYDRTLFLPEYGTLLEIRTKLLASMEAANNLTMNIPNLIPEK